MYLQYLSNADERMTWQTHELPSDDLCMENAIMIKRFNRYPLIIDPSGQATEFIMNEYKHRKITKTRSLAVRSHRHMGRQQTQFSPAFTVSAVWSQLTFVQHD